MMGHLRVPHRLHFAQARQSAELRKHQGHEMVPGREAFAVLVAIVALDNRRKATPRHRFDQAAEHRILIAHAKHSILSLFNQKDTTKPRWRLACSRNPLTHSPDSPALGWEHVNLTGDYIWSAERPATENRDELRPLRAAPDLLARPPEFALCPVMCEIRAFRYFWPVCRLWGFGGAGMPVSTGGRFQRASDAQYSNWYLRPRLVPAESAGVAPGVALVPVPTVPTTLSPLVMSISTLA